MEIQRAIGMSIYVKTKYNNLEFMEDFIKEFHNKINESQHLIDYLYFKNNDDH